LGQHDEPEGRKADVAPSGAGEGRESPMASSPGGLAAEPVASATVEGELGAVRITEALRTDEHLPELASCDLTRSGASPVVITIVVSTTGPIVVSTVVEEAPKDVAEETIKSGAMTSVAPTPFGIVIVAYKRPSFFAYF